MYCSNHQLLLIRTEFALYANYKVCNKHHLAFSLFQCLFMLWNKWLNVWYPDPNVCLVGNRIDEINDGCAKSLTKPYILSVVSVKSVLDSSINSFVLGEWPTRKFLRLRIWHHFCYKVRPHRLTSFWFRLQNLRESAIFFQSRDNIATLLLFINLIHQSRQYTGII